MVCGHASGREPTALQLPLLFPLPSIRGPTGKMGASSIFSIALSKSGCHVIGAQEWPMGCRYE